MERIGCDVFQLASGNRERGGRAGKMRGWCIENEEWHAGINGIRGDGLPFALLVIDSWDWRMADLAKKLRGQCGKDLVA